ncbi:MAG TPA: hypothetical protein VG797_09545 [Phycisphaerales bacterium]|nr:hypothetical protein [Phycisphaerales bacterium]
MKRHLFAQGVLLGAAIWVLPATASATIEASVSGSARNPPGPTLSESHASSLPAFQMDADVSNAIGGHGLAMAALDFGWGYMTGRTHSCVGPQSPFTDQAFGTSSISAVNEFMRVTYDGAPQPQNVSITFCYSITSNAYGSTREPSLTDTSHAQNQIVMNVAGQQIVNGLHGLNVQSGARIATQSFAGMTQETATLSGTFTRVLPVNFEFAFDVTAISQTEATSRSRAAAFPDVEASAGFAVTFGVSSITPGAHLIWRGQDWTGFCGDSSSLVPPNPYDTPAPGALAMFGLIGAMGTARRRR